MTAATQNATVVKKPKAFCTRTTVECIVLWWVLLRLWGGYRVASLERGDVAGRNVTVRRELVSPTRTVGLHEQGLARECQVRYEEQVPNPHRTDLHP